MDDLKGWTDMDPESCYRCMINTARNIIAHLDAQSEEEPCSRCCLVEGREWNGNDMRFQAGEGWICPSCWGRPGDVDTQDAEHARRTGSEAADIATLADSLATYVQSLNEWIRKGGSLPKLWAK